MMDYQKIGNGLQVAGIGTPALHMVGYLGKVSSVLFRIVQSSFFPLNVGRFFFFLLAFIFKKL